MVSDCIIRTSEESLSEARSVLAFIKVEFIVENKGKKTSAGHYGKAVKGRFIRFLAENSVQNIKEFKNFEYDGFKWETDHFVKRIN